MTKPKPKPKPMTKAERAQALVDELVMFYWAVEKRNNPCLPIPAGGRFGIDEDVGPSACIYSGIGRAVAPRYE